MKIQVNEDKEFANKIRQAIKAKDGYCPCVIGRQPESKCMCKDFREQTTPGFCHCKRFMKVEEEVKKDV